jgi:regulator of nonsense transcripts 2
MFNHPQSFSNPHKVVAILEKIFSRPGKVKYGNIHLLAILASALYRYHQDFVTSVIDNVLETIVLGLEQNDFKFNQRRIAEVKYLGELYNYRMVDHPVIFDTMYRIMTFGHGMWQERIASTLANVNTRWCSSTWSSKFL